jgi:ATP-dependent DNA helicase RecG
VEAVAATTDGFALAEVDLELRGEGDVLGDAQSGARRRCGFFASSPTPT